MKKRLLLAVAVFGVAISAASFNFSQNYASATVPGINALVDMNSSGTAASNQGASSGILSADGRFVALASNSTDLVAGYPYSGLFIRNLNTNDTERVDVSTAGIKGNIGSSLVAISGTGRYVLFTSQSTNLIDDTTIDGTNHQLYLRDTVSHTTVLISQNSSGEVANKDVAGEAVSSDGRFVLFRTKATNLGPTVTNTTVNAYMLDRDTNTFSILNYATDGSLPDDSNGVDAAMNCDGSLVVLRTHGLIIGSGDTNKENLYVLDRRAGNKLVNITASISEAAASAPVMSCNGDYIGFSAYISSNPTDLDPSANLSTGIYYIHDFVYDRINNTFTMADKSASGDAANQSVGCNQMFYTICQAVSMSVSDNGVMAFVSPATNLSSAVTNTYRNIYVHDTHSGATELLSMGSDGSGVNNDGATYWVPLPTISYDGSIAVYPSLATNLVTTTDTNNTVDLFSSLTGY